MPNLALLLPSIRVEEISAVSSAAEDGMRGLWLNKERSGAFYEKKFGECPTLFRFF